MEDTVQVHWVQGNDEDRAVCGKVVEGLARTTDPEVEEDADLCKRCLNLWVRFSARVPV